MRKHDLLIAFEKATHCSRKLVVTRLLSPISIISGPNKTLADKENSFQQFPISILNFINQLIIAVWWWNN